MKIKSGFGAPCHTSVGGGFRVAVSLPRGTNGQRTPAR